MTELQTLIPVPGPARPLRAPRVAEDRISNGLRVVVVRKPTVPRIEARLMLPSLGARNRAARNVFARTLTSGTSDRTASDIARELQRIGASLDAGGSPDFVQLSGSVLSPNFGAFLDIMAAVVTDASFPSDEVAIERARIVQQVAIARGQPQTIASEALMKRLFGTHPYGEGLPEPEAVARVSRAALRRLYETVVLPRNALLVIVGDVQPARATELVDGALRRWKGKRGGAAVPSPQPYKTGPMTLVNRPGAVQTNIRIAGTAPAMDADDAAATELANTIFGGYFISRLVENLRERNGYTYSPRSGLAHRPQAAYVQIAAEVGTDVTVPSLVETHYELGRMIALPVGEDELIAAQRYLTGLQSIRIQSQAGLASTLAGLSMFGLGIDYLRDYPKQIARVTIDDVQEASRRYLAPSKLVTVLVGDAEKVGRSLEMLGDVEVS